MSERERPIDLNIPRRVYGNFRQSVGERHAALKATGDWRKSRPGMSEAHLALIRQLPCVACAAISRVDPHHLCSGPAKRERGMALKSTDRWALPVCRFHHDEVHRLGSRNEGAWFHKWRIDPYELANALWHASGDFPRMYAILAEHKRAGLRALKAEAAINALMAHGLTRAAAEEQYDFTRSSKQ